MASISGDRKSDASPSLETSLDQSLSDLLRFESGNQVYSVGYGSKELPLKNYTWKGTKRNYCIRLLVRKKSDVSIIVTMDLAEFSEFCSLILGCFSSFFARSLFLG